MLTLHKTTPGFDMEKEVMCLLPKLPNMVEMKSLQSDLQMSRERLNQHLRAIANTYRVTYKPGKNDMAVGVPCMSWDRLDSDATDYYENIYERDMQDGI